MGPGPSQVVYMPPCIYLPGYMYTGGGGRGGVVPPARGTGRAPPRAGVPGLPGRVVLATKRAFLAVFTVGGHCQNEPSQTPDQKEGDLRGAKLEEGENRGNSRP